MVVFYVECPIWCSNIKQLHKLVKLQQKSPVENLIFYPLSQIEDLGVYELATTAISYCYYHEIIVISLLNSILISF